MWVLVVITFSVVGFVWFRSTQKKFVALLNPEAAQETRALAEKTKTGGFSPFATIMSSWSDLRANISELFIGQQMDFNLRNGAAEPSAMPLPPQKLPLSN